MIKMAEEEGTPDFGDEEKTMYHMGFAYMNRLNLLLYQCNEAARTDDIEAWYKALMNLLKELEAEMQGKEREEQDKTRIAGQKHFEEYQKKYANYMVTISSPRNRAYPFLIPPEIPMFMFKWELSLRRIIKRVGMLMPKADDPRFAMA